MAWYEGDWQHRPGGWSGRRGDPGVRGYRQQRGEQPWASLRPRGHIGYDPGFLGTEGSFGTGYDFGYQGGEWGRPVNARGFGTRGSYGTPEGRGPGGRTGRRAGRGAFNQDYGRDYVFGGSRGGASRGYLRGRGTEYGADYEDLPARARMPSRPEYGADFDGYYEGSFADDYERGDLGHPRASMGGADFAGRPDRHYGRGPGDRWPGREAARSDARLDDDDVLESVRENLFQDSFVNPDRIEVEVERGVVTLRGDVDDFLQARYAWDDAWESPGVRGVLNHLTVRTDRASDEMDMPQTE